MAVKFTPAPLPASRAVPAIEEAMFRVDPSMPQGSSPKYIGAHQVPIPQPEKPAFDKTAYQRELMRQRRAADREAGLVSVKLPADLVAKFKATGPGWQARINDVLAAAKV